MLYLILCWFCCWHLQWLAWFWGMGTSLVGAATWSINNFVTSKVLSRQTGVCRNKTCLLSWQKLYRDKNLFVMTIFFLQQNFCHDKQFCPKILLSRQTCVCRDKTHLLLQQKYACQDKTFVVTNMFITTNICCDKSFVMTNIILS